MDYCSVTVFWTPNWPTAHLSFQSVQAKKWDGTGDKEPPVPVLAVRHLVPRGRLFADGEECSLVVYITSQNQQIPPILIFASFMCHEKLLCKILSCHFLTFDNKVSLFCQAVFTGQSADVSTLLKYHCFATLAIPPFIFKIPPLFLKEHCLF